MKEAYTKNAWLPLLNKKVSIQFADGASYEFELIEISEGEPMRSHAEEAFSILFRGKATYPIFSQGIYQVVADQLDSVEIFLIPRLPDSEGIYYEATFN